MAHEAILADLFHTVYIQCVALICRVEQRATNARLIAAGIGLGSKPTGAFGGKIYEKAKNTVLNKYGDEELGSHFLAICDELVYEAYAVEFPKALDADALKNPQWDPANLERAREEMLLIEKFEIPTMRPLIADTLAYIDKLATLDGTENGQTYAEILASARADFLDKIRSAN